MCVHGGCIKPYLKLCVFLSVTQHSFAESLSGLPSFSLTSSRSKSCHSLETVHGKKKKGGGVMFYTLRTSVGLLHASAPVLIM